MRHRGKWIDDERMKKWLREQCEEVDGCWHRHTLQYQITRTNKAEARCLLVADEWRAWGAAK